MVFFVIKQKAKLVVFQLEFLWYFPGCSTGALRGKKQATGGVEMYRGVQYDNIYSLIIFIFLKILNKDN